MKFVAKVARLLSQRAGDLRRVAQTFREAQEARYLADYDPAQSFNRPDVLALIRNAEEAMTLIVAIRDRPEARFFFACLLAWNTLESRK
jgi:hypothetical protein